MERIKFEKDNNYFNGRFNLNSVNVSAIEVDQMTQEEKETASEFRYPFEIASDRDASRKRVIDMETLNQTYGREKASYYCRRD